MPSAEPAPGAAPGPIGPDYRFTLANERTFLAYERTAIGLVAAALAVFHLLEPGWPELLLAGLLLIAGAVAAVGGYARYRAVEQAIAEGRALPRDVPAQLLGAAVVLALAAAVLSVLV